MKKFIFSLTWLIVLNTSTLFSLDTKVIAERIFQLVNQERSKKGLPPYHHSYPLTKLALYHSTNMKENNFFSHTDHQGRSPQQRAALLIPEILGGIGENIAYDYASSENEAAVKMMNAWMHSSGHKANILSKKYNFIGIGVTQENDKIYATQNFGDLMAELISADNTEWIEGASVRLKFRFLGDFSRDKLNILIYFPDPTVKFYMKNGMYYTGMGKYIPVWLDDNHFILDIQFKYGKGRYQVKMGQEPYVYEGFDLYIK